MGGPGDEFIDGAAGTAAWHVVHRERPTGWDRWLSVVEDVARYHDEFVDYSAINAEITMLRRRDDAHAVLRIEATGGYRYLAPLILTTTDDVTGVLFGVGSQMYQARTGVQRRGCLPAV